MDYNKIEDTVLKKAMDIFQQSAVDFFRIDAKIIAPAETEIKNIEIKTNYTDYLFYTDDGNYLHFEFQTTDKKDDIKRFLYYDASLFYKEKRKVRTIVIYSSDIENVVSFIDAGTIKYNIEPYYMKKIDGDEKLEYLKEKIEKNENLTREDILTLTFLPLMNSEEGRSQRTLRSIELADKIKDSEDKTQSLTLLYALLEKFGDDLSKKRFKEVFSVTEIGKMIREEGIREGIREGKEEGVKEGLKKGKVDTLIKLLTKKFGRVSKDYESEIRNLSEDSIDIITIDIFEINDIKEIEKYF
jgi:predicted transposase YdaD